VSSRLLLVPDRLPGERNTQQAARSGRIEARSGLRMMPTFPRSPYHSVRRVFPSTAGMRKWEQENGVRVDLIAVDPASASAVDLSAVAQPAGREPWRSAV
jgi:hypothetical protein